MANYSLGEIDALARKATRGAGYSWGMAEEAGKSVRWLSAYGFLGSEILAKHLELVANSRQNFIPNDKEQLPDGNVFSNSEKAICSLYCATLINDLGHNLDADKKLSFNNVLSPLLALSTAGVIAEVYHISIAFTYEQTNIICNPDGIAINGTPHLLDSHSHTSLENDLVFLTEPMNLMCNRTEDIIKNIHFPSPQGRTITNEALVTLEKFAHRTYAPATEESRLRGAG